jgi:alginate O-acetyltransferase complex protein AlgI
MNFASTSFLAFLVVVLLVYHGLPTRAQKYRFLLLASWFFYLSWNPLFIWVLLLPTLIDYLAGLLIADAATPGRKKLWLVLGIGANLVLLGTFKYTAFVLANIASLVGWVGWETTGWTVEILLPLGISFYTFQGISYLLDVYQGRLPVVRSFTDFALYLAFFPQLVAGPIVRAVEFIPQMETPPRPSARQVLDGLHWVLLGLLKKLLIADQLAGFVDPVFRDPTAFDAVTLRWAVLAYACQIYCDFSGYSDIATGIAKWFGFELPINFNYPYLSTSIAEFWKRWHISLSTWIRDYVYFSLGGSRGTSLRTAGNLLLTLTLCGLWHGASWNYVLWGFYNGVLLVSHRVWDGSLTGRPWADTLRASSIYRALALVGTFLMVAAGLIFVRSESWAGCWLVQSVWLGGAHLGQSWVPIWVPFLVLLTVLEHVLGWVLSRVGAGRWVMPLPRVAFHVATIVALVVFGPGASRPFIYFQF